MTSFDPMRVLATLDPAPPAQGTALTDPQTSLATNLATPLPHRAPTRAPVHRRLILAGGAAALLAAAGVVVFDATRDAATPAYAATPPMLRFRMPLDPPDAVTLLGQIAAAAERSSPRGSGAYEYIHIQGWSLTQPEFMNRGQWSLDPHDSQVWRRVSDNSGRSIFRTPDMAAFSDDQAAATYGPGELPTFPIPGALATEPDQLRSLLTDTSVTSNAGRYSPLGIVALLAEHRVLPPAVRATLWQIVAELPGIAYAGQVTDRAGRTGEGFSMPYDAIAGPARDTLILDPATGEVLGFERVLEAITDPDHLARTLEHPNLSPLTIQTPAVVHYVAFLAAELRPTDR
jgi:hypothetical protein